MSIPFVIAGHVDHGKSTIGGHLLYKLGVISDEEMRKNREKAKQLGKDSFSFAFSFDSLEEERTSGTTIYYNTREFTCNDTQYELIDTPGHANRICSLIEALSTYQNLVGVLVVSLLPGEFESGITKGQTREVAILLRAVGIRNLLVLLNKVDGVDTDRIGEVTLGVKRFLKPLSFQTVEYLPVSGIRGDNLVEIPTIVKRLYSPKPPVEKKTEESRRWLAELVLLTTDVVVSSGFRCILHSDGKDREVEVEKIQSTDPYIKRAMVSTKVILTSNEFISGERFILRTLNQTIGFGTLCKPKN
jgi:translation elongation factor EF-1alpha